jgi:LysR family transcriptional regulator, regulator of gene expression of beta-lactamase
MRKTKANVNLSNVPLNALRAFEAAARHLSFTRAGLELRVSQAAVSLQVKGLEAQLGTKLFRRLPRGIALTDEGQALLGPLADALGQIRGLLDRFENGRLREVVTVGCVGTFATGWLLPRLEAFGALHPHIELRLLTNNNRVDLAGEGLDYAIRFGDGAWHGTKAMLLFAAPLSPLCAPQLARRLKRPSDLHRETLLRSYRADEWLRWFDAAGEDAPMIRGPIFDSSVTMAIAAEQGAGVALLPVSMFRSAYESARLVQPFATEITTGSYWLTRLGSKPESPGMHTFKSWMLNSIADEVSGAPASLPSSEPRSLRRTTRKN